jgi:hypothetical protein
LGYRLFSNCAEVSNIASTPARQKCQAQGYNIRVAHAFRLRISPEENLDGAGVSIAQNMLQDDGEIFHKGRFGAIARLTSSVGESNNTTHVKAKRAA